MITYAYPPSIRRLLRIDSAPVLRYDCIDEYTHSILACDYHSRLTLVLQDGWTALYWASGNGRLSVVKTLLKHGASVDVQTNVSTCLEG